MKNNTPSHTLLYHTALSWGVLVIGLLITVCISYFVKQDVTQAKQARFEVSVEPLKTAIINRIAIYQQVLQGCAAIVSMSRERQSWHDYITNLQLSSNNQYLGFRRIGFIEPTDDIHFPIVSVESIVSDLTHSTQVIGYDLAADPIQRVAIEYARHHKTLAITQKIEAVTDTNFVMYLPVYRQSTLLGLVFATVNVKEMMQSVVGQQVVESDFDIYDGLPSTNSGNDLLLYAHDVSHSLDYQPQFRKTEVITVAGRTWALLFMTSPQFDALTNSQLPKFILWGGSVVSMLWFIILRLLVVSYVINNQLRTEINERKRNEKRLFLLTNALPVCISYIDAEQRYRFVNKTYEQWYGYLRSEVYCQHLQNVLGSAAYRAIQENITSVLAGNTVIYEAKMPHHDDGGIRDISATLIPDIDEDNQVRGYYALLIDITARKWAEESLQQSRARLLEAQQLAHLGYWEWDLITGEEKCSAEMFQILGIPPRVKFTHELFEKALHPDDKNFVLQAFEQAIYHDTPYNIDFRMLRNDGAIRHMQAIGKLIRDNTGRPLRLIGTAQDITARNQAEEALRNSEERFELAMRGASDGLWDWNLETNAVYYSPRWKQMLGCTDQELSNDIEEWRKRIHPDDFPQAIADARAYLKKQKPSYEVVFRMRHKNGQYIWVLSRGSAVWNAQGKPIRVVGTHVDLTAQKQAEAALRDSEQALRRANAELNQFKTTLDMTLDCVYMNDAETLKFFYVNQGTLNHLGYTQAELFNMTPLDITPHFSLSQLQQMIAPLVEGVQPSVRFEMIHQRKNSVLIPVEGILQYIQLADRKGHFVSIVRDITERKQAEARLQQAKEAAEVANRAKSTFLANMSHELRTPLNAILGYTQILIRDNTLTLQHKEGIEIIQRNGDYLLTLITDILDLSKIEAGRIELYPRDLYLTPFIQEMVEIFQIRAKQKNIDFYYEALSPLPTIVRADEKRLRQIIINLLSNAIKFTEKGYITLKMGYIYGKMRIVVEDTGVGIATTELDKIFLPFIQAGEPKYQGEGTGLGLSITNKLVKLMGSRLHVKSLLGKGSIFWTELVLPEVLKKTEIPVLEQDDMNIVGFKGKSYKILVIDDKWENRSVLVNLLSPLGFDVAEAGSGQDGIDKAQIWRPDMILMDLIMSPMDGFETTRRLRQLPDLINTIIIAVSASVFDYHQRKSLQAGCNDFLVKPIRAQQLFEYLRKYLNLTWIYADELGKPLALDAARQVQNVADSSGQLVEYAHLTGSTPSIGLGNDYSYHELVDSTSGPNTEQASILYDLSMRGNIHGILNYLGQLEQTNHQISTFVRKIYHLAKHYKVKQIREIVKPYMDNSL